MLSRHMQVTRDGAYVRPPHAKLGYGGMLAVRALFVNTAASSLAKAVTIAVRYSAVRRQGGSQVRSRGGRGSCGIHCSRAQRLTYA